MPSAAFLVEMSRKRGSQPRTKIVYTPKGGGGSTDISSYFMEGANLEVVKERAPDEIQAGEFDLVLSNHDDKFSEYNSSSLFFEVDYHGAKIIISQGFILPDGSEEFETQGVGYIDQLITDPETSKVTLRCRDILWRIMDQTIRPRPESEIPSPGSSNIGNGIINRIDTLAFVTVNQTWTLTCTLGGTDGVATFSVVGTSSGSIGPATSGTEFTDSAEGIQFKITAGSTIWVVGDVFTFDTRQAPEWTFVNAGKIIWSILTGYNWDTDTEEPWSEHVFDYDRTQSSANPDLDYDSFVESIDNIDSIGFFDLKGFSNYDTDGIDFLQQILVLILGSLSTNNEGKVSLKTYIPTFGETSTTFEDDKKITQLTYNRMIDEVINSVQVNYIASENWSFSDNAVSLDGTYSKVNTGSIAKYKQLAQSFDIPWFTSSGQHVQDFANKLISKYGEPPLNIEFKTGMDALLTTIGDRVIVKDTKLSLDVIGEVALVSKQFDQTPTAINLMVRRDAEVDQQFGFIGSEVDEGDGLSPQSDDYDTATDSDRAFSYYGSIATTEPDYRMF